PPADGSVIFDSWTKITAKFWPLQTLSPRRRAEGERRHARRFAYMRTLCLLALVVARPAAASEPPSQVSVLTMGPGEHPFTRFGHNAILLEWQDGQNAVYNFGTFEFDGLKGAEDFMAGRFRYWLSVGTLEGTVRAYRAEGRSLAQQELALSYPEREQLAATLADNAKPEHRYYDYDYYRDNCSTRVRDVLDRLLGGQLRRSVTGPGRLSFRQHTLRLVGDTPWLYFGLDLALGTPTDRPTTRWEELFLPQELHDQLNRSIRALGDPYVPLVRAERELLPEQRPPALREPPSESALFAAAGTCLGLLLASAGFAATRRRSLRVAFGALSALLGCVLGLLGSALAIFSTSKHWAAHGNANLLACPPWSLALIVLGVAFALGRPHSARRLQLVLGATLITCALLLLFALTRAHRELLPVAALFLPLWAGWFLGARQATRQSSS
ncbi:MAG TPA: DUF4105 domain-containing protein, partial [Polyangiaceae bacterium]|nr:DUF4105 domain-containing protein [Polyangiaceae bacterium]